MCVQSLYDGSGVAGIDCDGMPTVMNHPKIIVVKGWNR
ncbi:hypothetical protein EDC30_11298 [Paucimonas lemoignei]|uniref:Uncharacterized protein n=1 Tax=Paucimonas lemoignei TaxID=29443 RepID=A0A4R3HTS5_PAULE|nr:hypothetical protein EDC30_11298 [Paucimonas lemoignei]